MSDRLVVQADAFAWMDATPAPDAASVVTSLPDTSELPHLALDAYKSWFVDTIRRVVRWIPSTGVAIFYQSDVRQSGVWIDKGYLVVRGAEEEGASLVWHKIVCRKPPGTVALGRPSYSHMICVSSSPRAHPRRPGPDVLPDAGFMPWTRAMGVEACRVACRFLRDETATRVVVDPFCGRGTVLAVANAMGFDAIGVDTGAKRCRAARALVLAEEQRDAEALFDAGAYWQAHEVWEQRWRAEVDPSAKRRLQALIQLAAALHKLLVAGDPAAASRLFAKAIAKLDDSSLREAVVRCAEAAGRAPFEPASIPRLRRG